MPLPLPVRKTSQVLLWLGLAAYFGGMLALGVAAPALFNTLRDTHAASPLLPGGPDAAPQLGGEVFGNVLKNFQVIEWISIAFILVGVLAQLLSPSARRKSAHNLAIMFAALLIVGCLDWFQTTPLLWKTRTEWRQALTAHDEPAAATLHAQFDALHRQSVRLAQAKLFLLFAMILLTAWTASNRVESASAKTPNAPKPPATPPN
jgi:hypothetical protein